MLLRASLQHTLHRVFAAGYIAGVIRDSLVALAVFATAVSVVMTRHDAAAGRRRSCAKQFIPTLLHKTLFSRLRSFKDVPGFVFDGSGRVFAKRLFTDALGDALAGQTF
jgi:hypothetical protein